VAIEAGAGVSLICKQLWAASLTVIAGQSVAFQRSYTAIKSEKNLSPFWILSAIVFARKCSSICAIRIIS